MLLYKQYAKCEVVEDHGMLLTVDNSPNGILLIQRDTDMLLNFFEIFSIFFLKFFNFKANRDNVRKR